MPVLSAANSEGGLSRPRMVFYIIVIIVFSALIFLFTVRGMRTFLVPSQSMEPTLLPGDYLLTFAQETYKRGDVVVLVDPEDPKSYIVKRIVGLGGDRLQIESGALWINGLYASEPYISEPMQYNIGEVVVPEGEVFVLGDNRNHSDDSGLWRQKTLKTDAIVGRVAYIYLPFSRMHAPRHYPLVNSEGG